MQKKQGVENGDDNKRERRQVSTLARNQPEKPPDRSIEHGFLSFFFYEFISQSMLSTVSAMDYRCRVVSAVNMSTTFSHLPSDL